MSSQATPSLVPLPSLDPEPMSASGIFTQRDEGCGRTDAAGGRKLVTVGRARAAIINTQRMINKGLRSEPAVQLHTSF